MSNDPVSGKLSALLSKKVEKDGKRVRMLIKKLIKEDIFFFIKEVRPYHLIQH